MIVNHAKPETKAKMIENETLDNTPDEVFEEDDDSSMDLSFFDEVNPW